ncbi:Ribose transport system permease protein rbsC [Serratia fonticola]|uniref:Ribose transport system permease protein rbsC n=1 Tax=Serratia fonticola TaxID=47917 RepID=A0A448T8S5_SERFO|nr:Ribose transport system permease protein rbsC [Serratia fonticola]
MGTFAALGLSFGIPFILVIPLSIMAALVLGLVNGSLTALAGIPSFIVTVATMGIFRGIAYIVTDGTPIMIKNEAFLALGNGEFLYIPIPIWILLVLLIVNHFILSKTTFGRKIYITGGNKEAAIYSGINVSALKIKVFMITAVMAGISGMILASRLYSGQPNAALSYELDAIAAAVLGGTSLNGGYGTVIGTMIGALTIGVINNGMNLMNVPYFYQMVVKGLVILIAVYVDVRNKKKRG